MREIGFWQVSAESVSSEGGGERERAAPAAEDGGGSA
jgi:hypothetical protein